MKHIRNRAAALITFVLLTGAPLTGTDYVIAVIDFSNATGEGAYEYLKIAIPEIFATNLAQSDGLTVLDRDRIKKMLREQGLSMTGITESDAYKIGKLLSARQILSGAIIKAGSELRIDVRLADVETGKIILADKFRCGNKDEIIDAIDSLSERIIGRMTGKKIIIGKDIEPDTPVPGGDLISAELTQLNKYYPEGSNEPYYLRLGFQAKEYRGKKTKMPINISVVLDTSHSMSYRGKIDYAKKALEYIIGSLDKDDIFSLVLYDDEASVAIPPTKAKEKDPLVRLVRSIKPGGGTNLSAGISAGYKLIEKNYHQERINRMLLLSDGLANAGITEPSELLRYIRNRTEKNISISTFGLGDYFNEKLMTAIAEYGRANYYYIDDSERIPIIFKNELSGMLTVVGQNASIEINPESGSSISDVYGYPWKSTGSGKAVINIGDIASNEKKFILLKIKTSSQQYGPSCILKARYIYTDAVGGRGRVTIEREAGLTYTRDLSLVKKGINPVVVKDIEMYSSSGIMEESMDLVDNGDFNKAKSQIDDNLKRIKDILKSINSKEMKKQAINIIEYKANIENYEKPNGSKDRETFLEMQKAGRNNQYLIRNRK